MRIIALDKWVFSTIIVAILINLASNFLGNASNLLSQVSTAILAVGLMTYVVARTATVGLNYYLYCRFSILVFVLDEQQRLLLYHHPYFNRFIPPGGRLGLSEAPDEAVGPRLRAKAGVNSFVFDKHFHSPRFPISELVEEVVRPFAVHREHRRQRGGVRSHYCFIYVCRLAGDARVNPDCRWMSLTDLLAMDVHLRPFDDIIAKYRLILAEYQRQSEGTACA
jgi:hypothetical protein